jgi:hypothetical protein
MSSIETAASLPTEAPHILEVQDTPITGAAADESVAIGVDDFEDALRDPRVKAFLEASREYGRALEEQDRNF